MLPASVRGTFADRFDPRLSVILGASIVIHFAIAIVALFTRRRDRQRHRRARLQPGRSSRTPTAIDLDRRQRRPSAGPGSAAAEKKPDKPAERQKAARPRRRRRAQRRPIRSRSQEQDAARFADLLTGEGPNGTSRGRHEPAPPGRRPRQAAQRDQRGQPDRRRSAAAPAGRRAATARSGSARATARRSTARAAPRARAAASSPRRRRAAGSRSPTSRRCDASSLSPDAVLVQDPVGVHGRPQALLHASILKKDASARGKVTLSLTVNETGRTVKGDAHGFAAEVDECIGGLMTSWRFPIPKDKDGEADRRELRDRAAAGPGLTRAGPGDHGPGSAAGPGSTAGPCGAAGPGGAVDPGGAVGPGAVRNPSIALLNSVGVLPQREVAGVREAPRARRSGSSRAISWIWSITITSSWSPSATAAGALIARSWSLVIPLGLRHTGAAPRPASSNPFGDLDARGSRRGTSACTRRTSRGGSARGLLPLAS